MKHKTYTDGILYNGDCLKVMPRLIKQGIKVDAIICDIPYGTTSCKWDSIIPFDKMWNNLNQLIKDNGVICLFGAEPFSSQLRCSNLKMYKYDWIWEKTKYSNFLCLKKQPAKNFENICVFYKHQPTYNPQMLKGKPYVDKGNRKQSSNQQNLGIKKILQVENTGTRFPNATIKFPNGNNHNVHPTQKPIPLMEYLVKTYTNDGDTVLDFTCGSGSTLVACRNLNRKFIGIELTEKYYNISKRRLKKDCLKSIF